MASVSSAAFATTIAKPSGLATGDMLGLFWFATASTAPDVVLSPFTSRLAVVPAGGSTWYGTFLTREVTGSEADPLVVNTNGYGVLFRITGAHDTSPYGAGSSHSLSGTAVNIPSFTPPIANGLYLAANMSGGGTPGDLSPGFTTNVSAGTAIKGYSKSYAAAAASGALTATNVNGTFTALAVSINPV